jgi:hypothetical protein
MKFRYLVLFLLIVSCTKKDVEVAEPAPAISNLQSEYYLLVRDSLLLTPAIETRVDSIVWIINGQRMANAKQFAFHAPANPATYNLVVIAYNSGNIFQKVIQIRTGRYVNYSTTTNALLQLEGTGNWQVLSAPADLYRLTSEGIFTAVTRGTYQLKAGSDTVLVTVRQPEKAQSPYLSGVFDYLPAPGQFVNELPKYVEGDTRETMITKASKELVGEDANMITLGGWGGYVVVGFDHTIVNVAGRKDFRILGNAFGANANPRPNAPFGGSCEPGIIMVAYDKNKNGKPDEDEWYEIKGSGNFSAENELWYTAAVSNKNDVRTFRDYQMTYSRPTTETSADTPSLHVSILNYIHWADNQGQQGYKIKNTFHAQSYYPAWIKDDKITYKGIRLAANSIDESGQGSYYVQYAFRYGYVDNYPNAHDNSAIDIDWAIDKNGNPITLPGIDFVKIYNGIDQENGWLGEASTEVSRGEDLHLLGVKIESVQ